jgi:hypothetical protein
MGRSGARRSSLVAVAMIVLAGAGAHAQNYAPQTLDHYFRLEWSKAGSAVNGYVYSSANRRAVRMQLAVEGLDGSGKVVTKTLTWIRDVPPNNRAYFETPVPNAASYRVRILSFDWIEDRDPIDRRKAW